MKTHLEKLIINITIYAEKTNVDALTLINATKELKKCEVEKYIYCNNLFCRIKMEPA